MIDFFNTVRGHRLVDGTLPNLVRELETLNRNLVRIADALEKTSALPDADYRRQLGYAAAEIVSANEGREL